MCADVGKMVVDQGEDDLDLDRCMNDVGEWWYRKQEKE